MTNIYSEHSNICESLVLDEEENTADVKVSSTL